MGILIQTPGVLTTVQDLGRMGHQACGVSPSGAMDQKSTRLANILVGNRENEGVLEVTLGGAGIVFRRSNVIAICGAPAPTVLDRQPVPFYKALSVRAGQTLSFQYAPQGMRTYIAFAGGLDIPLVMGSRSTHLKSGIGGFHGRKLQQGDYIGFRSPRAYLPHQELRRVEEEHFPRSGETVSIRLLLGPQEDAFTKLGQGTLFESLYEISQNSDRMGYRLIGQPIESKNGSDIITDGIALGSVQIPPSGLPIIMMADRQTTGGYAKIATVITQDISLLAQCPPGVKLRFVQCDVETAQALRIAGRRNIEALIRRFQHMTGSSYWVQVNGKTYFVTLEAGT